MSEIRRERGLVPRWVQLIAGLALYGVAISLMVRSGLGLGPWDAFHYGLHRFTGITLGGASIAVGFAILVCTWFLGVRPGAGTLANMVLIGVFIDLMLPWTPPAAGAVAGTVYYLGAILACGLATGMYIGAGLGEGPRDGMMLGIALRTRWPVRRVRTLIELTVLALGWWMGARLGPGTVLFALLIGPSVQWGLELFGVGRRRSPAPAMELEASAASAAGLPHRPSSSSIVAVDGPRAR